MSIHPGDLYWVQLEGRDVVHPHLVIQENVDNHGRTATVVVAALTTNRKRIDLPGNVLLEEGEANLPKQSIVAVSQVSTVEVGQVGEYIGTLSKERLDQVLAGMHFVQRMSAHATFRRNS
ncbi:MAG: type II toxin-antitoxin system PemK/MazF family toxin [Anaerolineales bacterium]|nr:type II toxin-antitoxin system PemK/MazF family toxin [Anaerolineales bacterium]